MSIAKLSEKSTDTGYKWNEEHSTNVYGSMDGAGIRMKQSTMEES